MRTGTILVLLGLILMFAFFGWEAFGWLALFVLALLVAGALTVAVAVWALKRRMRRHLEALGRALAGERGGPGSGAPPAAGRRDAIDVEPVVRRPRDGADAPEDP